MRLFIYFTVLSGLSVFCATSALAKPLPQGWSGNVQFGAVQTTGNTDSSTADGKFKVNYVQQAWQNTLRMSDLYTATNGATTAQSWMGSNQARYSFTKHNYVFGLINAQAVRFSGYDYQVSEVLGLGRRVYDTPRQTLDVEAGAGARQSKLTGGSQDDVAVGRLGAGYSFDITSHSDFHQHLSAEIGKNNTYFESVSSLKLAIYGALSANLSYTISHNTNVPAGTSKTNTITAVALEYGF